MDKISIIIRNRNESEYIGFAIQSVIDHIKDPEIIIVDNQSTDESMKIVSLFDKYNIKKYNINGNYTQCELDTNDNTPSGPSACKPKAANCNPIMSVNGLPFCKQATWIPHSRDVFDCECEENATSGKENYKVNKLYLYIFITTFCINELCVSWTTGGYNQVAPIYAEPNSKS